MATNTEQLIQKIQSLDTAQTSDAIRNLRLSLQYHWGHTVENEEVNRELQKITSSGPSVLSEAVLADDQAPSSIERWGKALLLFCADDPALVTYVAEAIDDALDTTVKDF